MPTKELYDKYLAQEFAAEKEKAEQKLAKEGYKKQEARSKKQEARDKKALKNINNETILGEGNSFINSVAKYNYFNFLEKKKFYTALLNHQEKIMRNIKT